MCLYKETYKIYLTIKHRNQLLILEVIILKYITYKVEIIIPPLLGREGRVYANLTPTSEVISSRPSAQEKTPDSNEVQETTEQKSNVEI